LPRVSRSIAALAKALHDQQDLHHALFAHANAAEDP